MICLAKSWCVAACIQAGSVTNSFSEFEGLSSMPEVVLRAESGASLGMRGVDLPAPMHGLAIQAKSRVDE